MKKLIVVFAAALSSLMFVAGGAKAGCRSGGWGWSRAPAYQYYYYAPSYSYTPAPSTAPQTGSTYRSYSYQPGAAQQSYQYNQYYYAPRSFSAPRPSGSFPADAKFRGNVMGH